MTAAERLRATRRALATIAAARAGVWTAVALAAVALVGLVLDRVAGAPTPWAHVPALRTVGLGAIAATGAAAIARPLARRPRARWTLAAVALWIEARVPTLRYALVTLADRGADAADLPAPVARALAARVQDARWDNAVQTAARTALTRPATALAVLLLSLAAVHRLPSALRLSDVAIARRAVTGVGARASFGAPVDPLAHIRATIVAPSYARQPIRTLDDVAAVSALVGSTIVIDGAGDPAQLHASFVAQAPNTSDAAIDTFTAAPHATVPAPGASLPVRAAGDGGRWRVVFTMPSAPVALRLAGPRRDRLVVLDPRPDRPPRVALLAPARDTVVRAAQGSVALRARADDDLGLVDGGFEYVVSSGEGENFTFRTGRIGTAAFGGARAAPLTASLDLAALSLKPGDLVHVRALARDARPGATPGASETRAIRVARAGEYDSVAVDGAPPPDADTAAFGQRMLLQLTEALVARADARRSPLARPLVIAESRRIGGDQARLRRRVGDAVFSRLGAQPAGEESQGSADASERRGKLTPQELLAEASGATGAGAGGALEGDEAETPVTAVNKPLLAAYNAMWEAGRALEGGEPRAAIPPMHRAIAALERARQAERLYLRGRPPVVVVDLAKVRGAGHLRADTLHPAARDADSRALYPALDPAARGRAAALDRALVALARGGSARAAAADSLALLRVSALGSAPALAAALGDALSSLAHGDDATAALTRARRAALGPPAPAATGAGAWSAGWQDLQAPPRARSSPAPP